MVKVYIGSVECLLPWAFWWTHNVRHVLGPMNPDWPEVYRDWDRDATLHVFVLFAPFVWAWCQVHKFLGWLWLKSMRSIGKPHMLWRHSGAESSLEYKSYWLDKKYD